MDKVSVYCLDPLNFRCLSRYQLFIILDLTLKDNKELNESVLCYEVLKKWPLLSLFPDRIRETLPYFHLTIILEPY